MGGNVIQCITDIIHSLINCIGKFRMKLLWFNSAGVDRRLECVRRCRNTKGVLGSFNHVYYEIHSVDNHHHHIEYKIKALCIARDVVYSCPVFVDTFDLCCSSWVYILSHSLIQFLPSSSQDFTKLIELLSISCKVRQRFDDMLLPSSSTMLFPNLFSCKL